MPTSRAVAAIPHGIALTALLLALAAAPGSAAPPSLDRSGTTGLAPGPDPRSMGAKAIRKQEKRVLKISNRKRVKHGCKRLKLRKPLRKAARKHSRLMAKHQTMSHQLPGEAGLGDRISAAGYRGWTRLAENVAYGQPKASAVVRAWMNSPGHRSNILDCRLRHLGVGLVVSGGTTWWTQNFGRQ